MDLTAELDTSAPASCLFAWVEDLGTYPRWLEIVTRAEPAPASSGSEGHADAAWVVELRGRLGPLARTKRLRMVRAEHEPHRSVTFERRELDGRQHSSWVLRATVSDDGSRSRLEMHMHYDGGLFGAVLERLLRDEIRRSRSRLQALAEVGPPA